MHTLKFLNSKIPQKIDSDTYSFLQKEDDIKLFDISMDDYTTIQKKLKSQHWMDVIYDMYYENSPWLFNIITNSNRSDFLFHLNIEKDDLALDLGAGWGQITIPLSRFCNVVALEGNMQKIEILKKIAKQENRNNIHFIGANIVNPIFENDQFNLIILNGVLEWIPKFSTGEPLRLQKDVLKNCYDILQSKGTLYIGIENKIGLKYLLGEKDDHTLLEDFVYIDKDSQGAFFNALTKKQLHVFTHRKETYEKLLIDAGFDDISFFAALPDYKLIKSLVDISNNIPTSFIKNNAEFIPEYDGGTGILSKLNTKLQYIYSILSSDELRNLFPSYSIIARKS